MNILEKVLRYDNHIKPDSVDFSASELSGKSNYQLWLSKIGREKNYEIPLDNVVSSKIGTGFHMLAEEAMMATDMPMAWIEELLVGELAGVKVSGTPDIIYRDRSGVYTVGDYKTKGNYQMKKTLTGNYRDIIIQESIYAHLFAQNMNIDPPQIGEAYLLRVGDKGYWTKKEMAMYGFNNSTIPNRHTETLTLLTLEELEEYIHEKLETIETEPEVDCQEWMCGWCNFDCEFRL